MFDYINKKMSQLSIAGMMTLGRYSEALEIIEKQLETDSNNLELTYQRGVCEYNLNNYQEAVASFERVCGDDWGENQNYRNGQHDQHGQHGQHDQHDRRRGGLIGLGDCYMVLGEIEKSVHAYEKAIEIKSLSRKETLNYVKSLMKKGNYQKAIDQLKQNNSITNDLMDILDVDIQKLKIELFIKSEDPERALAIIEKMEPLNIRNDVKLDLYKAEALLTLGRVEESGFIVDRLMGKIPTSSYLKSLYARILRKRGNPEEALSIIKEALKSKPKDEKLHNTNLELLIETKNYKEALITLEGVSNVIPKSDYLNIKSKIFFGMGDIDKASNYNTKAILENNNLAEPYIMKAEISYQLYIKSKNKETTTLYNAIENLTKAMTMTKDREKIQKINKIKDNIESQLSH